MALTTVGINDGGSVISAIYAYRQHIIDPVAALPGQSRNRMILRVEMIRLWLQTLFNNPACNLYQILILLI